MPIINFRLQKEVRTDPQGKLPQAGKLQTYQEGYIGYKKKVRRLVRRSAEEAFD